MKIELVDFQHQDCQVVYNNKVYQLCFVFDGGIVLSDDISGVHCFPSDNNIEEQIKQVKHIAVDGHLQFGSTKYLQGLLNSD